ncbi:FadR/GntR family transcriptional regulator [Amycolatopsis sp. GM8]|uniref:FadR/GntR family transcriptional regulator n=1 Tax=Amycolatopsis sp. GM8 TaxID=2896530 RepID=UPI001F3FBA78|nr:FCD domain-containing protein [Amycolatopsis sp. GM8]
MQKSDHSRNGGRRRYLAVAQDLLTAIASGRYEVGARLPAHTEIAARAGVSRATAREAFLALELIGAIEVRHGDGTFVRGPAARAAGTTGSPFDLPPRELIETRLHIEPVVATLAAARMSDEQIAILRRHTDEQAELVNDAEHVARFVALGLEFHADLATYCGNHLLADIVSQLVNIERHPLWALVNQQGLPNPASRQSHIDEHRAILDAIENGNASAAAAHMHEHLDTIDRTTLDIFDDPEQRRAR